MIAGGPEILVRDLLHDPPTPAFAGIEHSVAGYNISFTLDAEEPEAWADIVAEPAPSIFDALTAARDRIGRPPVDSGTYASAFGAAARRIAGEVDGTAAAMASIRHEGELRHRCLELGISRAQLRDTARLTGEPEDRILVALEGLRRQLAHPRGRSSIPARK